MQNRLRSKYVSMSKVYETNGNSITMNNDRSHQKMNQQKVEEAKNIMQKKQMDKILFNVIKERLFGNFLNQQNAISVENVHHLDQICKQNINKSAFSHNYDTISFNRTSTFRSVRKRNSFSDDENLVKKYETIDVSSPTKSGRKGRKGRKGSQLNSEQILPLRSAQKKLLHEKLPLLKLKSHIAKTNISEPQQKNKFYPIFHDKKLQLDEKQFVDFFRKMSPNPTQLIYDTKITRQNVINKNKNRIDCKILERFFHFFGFPQVMGFRNYINLIENAVNSDLRFIYFYVFALFDDSSNGFIGPSQMFNFLKKMPDNQYLEQQMYFLTNQVARIQSMKKTQKQKNYQPLVEQLLIIDHNLKIEQLRQLLKESTKQRIGGSCVKSTVYHQTVLSLQHDSGVRLKQDQIQTTQINSKKNQNNSKKKKIQTGLRLRDFYSIFEGKRPKVFCFIIHILTGLKGSDYE